MVRLFYLLYITFFTATGFLLNVGVSQGQTKTLDGIIADQKGNPQKEVTAKLNTDTGETDVTGDDGTYHLSTQDFPTGIFDIARVQELLKIYPNPAQDHATVEVPGMRGTVEVYNELGQQLGQTTNLNDDLQFMGNRAVIFRYTSDKGEVQTGKLLIKGKNNVNVDIHTPNEHGNNQKSLKSATLEDDTFGYKLTLTGANIKDTIVDIIGFYKDQTQHTQDITVNSKPQLINEGYAGETFQADTVKKALEELIYSDDALQASINFAEGDAAKIRNDSLLVYGNTKLSVTASDGENEPVTTQTMQFTKEIPSITINGKTLVIGKVAEARNYDINDPDYVSSRTQGGMTFFLTNEDGSFYQEITSDAQGNFTTTVPSKGDYFYGVEPSAMTHEALIKMIVDATENNEIVSAYNGSKENAMKVHMRYQDDGNGNPIPPNTPARTSSWNPDYLEEGVMNHLILNKVWDMSISKFTDEEISQAMIDTVLSIRTNKLDPIMNDFYKNGNTIITDDPSVVPKAGKTNFYWFTNANAAGYFGKTEENGQVRTASMSVNKSYWNDGTNNVLVALIQEQLSAKAFYELIKSDEPSVLDGEHPTTYITSDDKRSLEWYQIRSQMLSDDGVPEKGMWGWDIDPRALEEGVNNPYIQGFMEQDFVTQEARDQFNMNKSASLKSAGIENTLTYTLNTLMPDGTSTTRIFTADNFEEALQDNDIPGFYKQEIAQVFEIKPEIIENQFK